MARLPSGALNSERRSPVLDVVLRLSLDRPRLVLGVWAAVLVLAGFGVARLEFDTTASSLLNRTGPGWERYQDSLATFGGDEILVAAVSGDRPWDPAALREVVRLTHLAEGLPGVRRVDSLATVPIVWSAPDGTLRLDPALGDDPPDTLEEAQQIARLAERDRIAPRSLVSADGRTFAVNLLLDDTGEHQERVVAAMERATRETGWVSGVPLFETRVGPRTQSEVLLFVPITLALIGGLLYALFRSVVAVVVPLLSSAAGAWVVVGFMGAMGEPMTIVAMLLPSILLALGCAYLMHVLTELDRARTPEGLREVLREVAPLIALSGLTTAIGFFAISTVDIDAIRALGAFGGIGVLLVLAGALSLAPALLRLHLPRSPRSSTLDRAIRGRVSVQAVSAIARGRFVLLGIWLAIFAATGLGLARLQIETDGTRWWPPGTPVRDAYESIRERLSGISPMNIVIRSQGGRPVTDPDVLERIDALARHLQGLPEVGKAVSLADPLRQIHGGFVDDPGAPLPGRRDLAEQYLLLLESVDHMGDLVSDDRQVANVLMRVDDNGSMHLLDVAGRAERWWREHGADDFSTHTTGIMFEFARAQDAIAWGQIRGLGLALGAIAVVLLLLFRAPLLAAVALVPNAVPLVIMFGTMGLLGIPLDAGTACLGSLALGIAVDDTIHVVTRYRSARVAGRPAVEALRETFARVLPALTYTTGAIGLGFAVLGFSEFTLTRNLGLVTATLVVLCLVADLTLLPALLLPRTGRR